MLYLLVIQAFKFKENFGYRIKLAGDEERYVAAIGGSVRTMLANDISANPSAQAVVELFKRGRDSYAMRFCDRFLTVKPADSGVVAGNYDDESLEEYDIQVVGNAYKIFNVRKERCLAQTTSYDSSDKGFKLNTRPCQDNLPNKFVFLEVGPIYYHCPELAAAFCEAGDDLGLVHGNMKPPGLGYSNDWSFDGQYNTNTNWEFSIDFDWPF